MAACGGGGGDGDDSDAPSVATVSTVETSVRFGQPLTVAVTGSALTRGLRAESELCSSLDRLQEAPYVSDDRQAWFRCTLQRTGSGTIQVFDAGSGDLLGSTTIVVPEARVTMAISDGGALAGTWTIALDADRAPATVRNFLQYVADGFYVGTVVHRVSPGFVVQAGGYAAPLATADATPKPGRPPIALETAATSGHVQWTVAMARSTLADTATSQFFINLADNRAALDASPLTGPGYAVFGTVIGGTSAVSAVASAACTAIPFFLPSGECTPLPNVVITAATQTQ